MDFKALAHDLVRGKENNKLNQIQKVYEESNQTNKGVSLAFYEQINTK
jgi:hypothetical protein